MVVIVVVVPLMVVAVLRMIEVSSIKATKVLHCFLLVRPAARGANYGHQVCPRAYRAVKNQQMHLKKLPY